MLKVYVDASTSDNGGMGTFVHSLVPQLVEANPDWEFSGVVPISLSAETPNINWTRTFDKAGRLSKIVLQQGLRRDIAQAMTGADVGLSLGQVSPLLRRSTRWIEVVHDWRHVISPDEFGLFTKAYRRVVYPLSVSRCAALVYISEGMLAETKEIVGDRLNQKEGRVIRHGGDHVLRDSPSRKGDYVLAYGHWPNKRPELAVLVWANAVKSGAASSWRLKIVGLSDARITELMNVARQAGVGDSVDLFGYLPAQKFDEIRQSASIQMITSSYEGFGLPVLEALTLGQFVLATAGVGMEEAGGNSTCFCDWSDMSSAGQTLARAINDHDLRMSGVQAGYKFARSMTWQNSAREYARFVQDVVAMAS